MGDGSFVWQDKLSFSERVVFKELELVSQYTATINAIKYNSYPLARLKELNDFKYCWANCNNLFDILYLDYGGKLGEEKLKKLKKIMLKYTDLNEVQTLEDLTAAKTLIVEMLSLAGFHNLK